MSRMTLTWPGLTATRDLRIIGYVLSGGRSACGELSRVESPIPFSDELTLGSTGAGKLLSRRQMLQERSRWRHLASEVVGQGQAAGDHPRQEQVAPETSDTIACQSPIGAAHLNRKVPVTTTAYP